MKGGGAKFLNFTICIYVSICLSIHYERSYPEPYFICESGTLGLATLAFIKGGIAYFHSVCWGQHFPVCFEGSYPEPQH